jgi:AcrR family transcriptional regulator
VDFVPSLCSLWLAFKKSLFRERSKRMTRKAGNNKREIILQAAKKLFAKQGYDNTSVREIVLKANTSMGNLYFHFPNKQTILKVICKEYVNILRNQIKIIHDLSFRPEVGFALDFRIGYITTLEHPKTSQVFSAAQNIPEIHEYSLENKRVRLKTFFCDSVSPDEVNYLAIAIQGIADGIFDQKREGKLTEKSSVLSNTIIDYSLRLIGYSKSEITRTIDEVDDYIKQHHITIDKYFNF